ncbi:MAG: site-specific DNA-methyltransferase, partial [Candidatus Sungiibacteriota bacterium]
MSNNGIHRKKDSARIVWDSKPHRAPNPKDIEFQTAEVVIPNPETAGTLPMSFQDKLLGEEELDKQKMNRLIWGDNLLAMQALLNQGYEGKINLIYIDPPFDSKADYSHKIKLGETEFTKEPSVIERLAYKDTWAGGTDSYLDMLYPRLQLMKRLLAPDGSIYVHLDWHVGHYVKVMMDEIFGKENFRNEIIWHYQQGTKPENDFGRKHDVIFRYAKSNIAKFHQLRLPTTDPERYVYDDGDGRKYVLGGSGMQTKYYAEDARPCDDVWTWLDKWDPDRILQINPVALERVEYDTQKPEKLLERIIKTSSDEGDLVADFFGGSSTSLVVAEKLNRHWIGCELGKVGIQVSRGRMVEMKSKPFLIENIGNYQREMIYLGGVRIYEMQRIILKLYGAEPMANRKDLGVRKAEDGTLELVYCGYPDRAVAAHKVEDLATEAQMLDGAGYKRLVILAWDYEYN